MTLNELGIGKSAVITSVGGEGALRRHLLDMGLTPRTLVTVRKRAPMGDPVEIRLRGYELTLRLEDAQKIAIEPAAPPAAPRDPGSAPKKHGGFRWLHRKITYQ